MHLAFLFVSITWCLWSETLTERQKYPQPGQQWCFTMCERCISHNTIRDTRLDGRIVSPFTITLVQPTSWNTQRMGETTQERRGVISDQMVCFRLVLILVIFHVLHFFIYAILLDFVLHFHDSTEVLLVTSRIVYCNSLLVGILEKQFHWLQLIQNSAARIVINSFFDLISPILFQLHWLLVHYRVHFKIVLLTYKALHNLAPHYLSDLLRLYTPLRSLRSSSADLFPILKFR